MAKSKMSNEKKKKIKIGVLASLGGLALIGGGVCIGYFGKETINYFFDRNRDMSIDALEAENQVEEFINYDSEIKTKWKYLGSAEEKLDEKVTEEYKDKKNLRSHIPNRTRI